MICCIVRNCAVYLHYELVGESSDVHNPEKGPRDMTFDHCPEFCQECTERVETTFPGGPRQSRFKPICCITHADVSSSVPRLMLWHGCESCRNKPGQPDSTVEVLLTDLHRFKKDINTTKDSR